MTMSIEWLGVVTRTDLEGGDVEYFQGTEILCGPLHQIRQEPERLVLECLWLARFDPCKLTWIRWHTSRILVPAHVVPREIDDRRVTFEIPDSGTCTLCPKDQGNMIDPRYVKGLPRDWRWRRLLVLNPGLPWEPEKALDVCRELSMPSAVISLSKPTQKFTLLTFLKTFVYDSSRERFLFAYIKKVVWN